MKMMTELKPKRGGGLLALAVLAGGLALRVAGPGQGEPGPELADPVPVDLGDAVAEAVDSAADAGGGRGRVEVEGAARAIDLRFQGLVLRLHRIELTDDELRLRIGFQNATALPIQAFGSLEPGLVWLEQADAGVPDMLSCREVDPRLRTYLPEGGLAAGTAVVGELVFPRPPEGQRAWQLTIPGFEALEFSWQLSDVQAPAAGEAEQDRSAAGERRGRPGAGASGHRGDRG